MVHEPTPANDELKRNPELKAKAKAMNERIKAKQRLIASQHPCYAELSTIHILYHKAMMHSSKLSTGWISCDFGDQQMAKKIAAGQVKNPLDEFPPKTPEKVTAAKAELRDAYNKDFIEYVQKKVMP